MFLLTVPLHSAFAAMIDTATVIDMERVQETRNLLTNMLARQDVMDTLVGQGIDPQEATARVASLSDTEVMKIADQIESLPAGGNVIGLLVAVALVVFLVLLITDMTGATNVFPWVKSQR